MRRLLSPFIALVVAVAGLALGDRQAMAQQPDPKKRELSASVTRSIDNETVTLNAFIPDDAPTLRVAFYNLLGKLIEVHPAASATKGDQVYRFQTRGLPSGPYIVVLEANGQRVTCKVMVSR